jgi:DHA2 family multidrug resistance protein
MQNKAVVENIEYPTGIVRAVIVGTCVVASLLAIIDSTVVNVSLRHIAGSLGASTTDVAWVITAFAISNVIIIPLSGMLAELFGTKVYFTASILIFTISSFMCGNSTELWELILWRFIQGLGGGALMTQSQTILAGIVPPEAVRPGKCHLRYRHSSRSGSGPHSGRIYHRQLFLALGLLYQRTLRVIGCNHILVVDT